MKKITETHEWVFLEGQQVTFGITQKAQQELGDVVYVELPKVGATFQQGDVVVVLESTKAAIDLYAPLSGTITAINSRLKEEPHLLNTAPETEGWIFKMILTSPAEWDTLPHPLAP